jgi:hypothetical protein
MARFSIGLEKLLKRVLGASLIVKKVTLTSRHYYGLRYTTRGPESWFSSPYFNGVFYETINKNSVDCICTLLFFIL